MKIEQNTLIREWIIKHEGRTLFVDFIESDVQIPALINHDNWEITEETDEGRMELNGDVFDSMTDPQQRIAKKEAALIKAVIRFCIEYWDNKFMQEVKQDLVRHADNQK